MKIVIIGGLKDPKYCEGCPLLHYEKDDAVVSCTMDDLFYMGVREQGRLSKMDVIRPQRCIESFGV